MTLIDSSVLRFTIRGRFPSLNKFYAGTHYRDRQRLKDQWRNYVYFTLVERGLLPVTAYRVPVLIAVTATNPRALDVDNVGAVAKLIIDGLRVAGVLVDDTPRHVCELRLRSLKGQPQVEVEVRPCSES